MGVCMGILSITHITRNQEPRRSSLSPGEVGDTPFALHKNEMIIESREVMSEGTFVTDGTKCDARSKK